MLFLIFAGGRPSNANPSPHLLTGVSLDGLLAVLFFAMIAWLTYSTVRGLRRVPSDGNRVGRERLILLLLWLLLPPTIAFVASYVWKPCFVYRYLLYSSLPMYLMAGGALSAMRTRVARAALAGALVAVYGYQLSALATGPLRPDWRAVSGYLESRVASVDTVIVFQSLNLSALEFNSKLPKSQMRCADVWSEICPDVLDALARGDAWIVVWLWSNPANIEACFPQHDLTYTATDFGGWPPLRVYHVPRPQG